MPVPGADWSSDDWNTVYKSVPVAPWVPKHVDKYLLKYEEKLLGTRDHHKLFFPLCGEVVDMKWAYDKGHDVIGVDCVDDSLRKFFETYDIQYRETSMDGINGTLFKSEDGRIRLYGCNIQDFKSELERNCTAIFDSAGIICLNKSDIPGYCQLMKEMMSADCRCLMFTLELDESIFPGPPRNLPIDLVKTHMGDKFIYEHLETADVLQDFQDRGPAEGEGQPPRGEGRTDGREGQPFIETHKASMKNLDHMWGRYTLIYRR